MKTMQRKLAVIGAVAAPSAVESGIKATVSSVKERISGSTSDAVRLIEALSSVIAVAESVVAVPVAVMPAAAATNAGASATAGARSAVAATAAAAAPVAKVASCPVGIGKAAARDVMAISIPPAELLMELKLVAAVEPEFAIAVTAFPTVSALPDKRPIGIAAAAAATARAARPTAAAADPVPAKTALAAKAAIETASAAKETAEAAP